MNVIERFRISFLMILFVILSMVLSEVAEARVINNTTNLSNSRTQYQSVTLPNFIKLNNVSVDNGNVSYTMSGNTINLTLTNGIIQDQDYNSTYYSKYVDSQTSNYYSDYNGYSGYLGSYVYSGTPYGTMSSSDSLTRSDTYFPSTIYKNISGYTGYLGTSGGASTISGSYTASSSRTETVTDSTGHAYNTFTCGNGKYWLKDHYHTDIGNRREYSSGGFYGTLHRTHIEWRSWLGPRITEGQSCTGNGSVNSGEYFFTYFTGVVTRPASDTRVYRQNYSGILTRPDTEVIRYRGTVYAGEYVNQRYNYTITIDYVDNRAPVLTGDISSGNYSENSGYNTINITGNVSDADGDSSTIRYSVGNKSGVLVSDVIGNFSGDIIVDGQVPEGNQTVRVWADDGKSGGISNTVAQNIYVDKTHPTISHVLSPGGWTTGNMVITATGHDTTGVRSVSPNPQTAYDNGDFIFNTEDTLSNSGTRSVTVSSIDRHAPTISILSNGNLTYEKSHSTVVSVFDTRDGINSGSGNKQLEYSWSTTTGTPTSDWSDFTTGSTLSTPIGVTGDYYLHIRAEDNLGQISHSTSNVFKVDNTIPNVGELNLSLGGIGVLNSSIEGISDDHADVDLSNAHSFKLDNLAYTPWGGKDYIYTGLEGNRVYDITYKIRDRAGNEAIVSVPKSLRSMTYNPNGLVVTGLSDVSITTRITEGNNIPGSYYEVFVKDMSDNIKGSNSLYSDSLINRTVTDLDVNVPYSVWVRSRNIDGVETIPDIKLLDSVYSGAEVPGLELIGVTTNSMELDIERYRNNIGTQYFVERALNSSFSSGRTVLNNWTSSLDVNSNSLIAGQTYYYRIKARNGDRVETSYSEVYSFKAIPSQVVLNQPVVLPYVIDEDGAGVKLNWNSVLGVDKYYIYRDGLKIEDVNSNIISFEDSLSNFNQSYIYNISGWNAQGEGSKSADRSIYTRAKNIESIEISDLDDSVATFDITNSGKNTITPATFIEVKRKSNGSLAGSSAFSKNEKNRQVIGLQLGVAYEAWVTVRNEDNILNPAVKVIDEFYMNRPPEIALELGSDKYSEVTGFNEILVRGQIKDLDTIPVGDPLDLFYTIKDSAGKIVLDHNNIRLDTDVVSTGDWQNIIYNISLTDSLVEGYYSIEVKVIDDQFEEAIGSKNFLIDRTLPLGKLKEINGPNMYEITTEVFEVNGDISGLHSSPYLVERSTNRGNFGIYADWNSSLIHKNIISLEEVNTNRIVETNTKYAFRYKIRDLVGHVTTTNIVEYVTSTKLKDREVDYLVSDPSTIVLEWEKALKNSEGVKLEIKRNGHLVAIIENGDRFLDHNLDYERDYVYDIIAFSTDENGNRINSLNVRKEVMTGQPLVQFVLVDDKGRSLYDDIKDVYEVNRTIFRDDFKVSSEVFYRPGGNAEITYADNSGNKYKEFKVSPYETKKVVLDVISQVGSLIPMSVEIIEATIPTDVDLTAEILLKNVKVVDKSKEDLIKTYGKVYK